MMDGMSLYLKSYRSNPWNDDFDTGCGSDETMLSNVSAERADVQRAVVMRMGMIWFMVCPGLFCLGRVLAYGNDFVE